MPVVTRIRVGQSFDRSHNHIIGVYTDDGTYRTNRQVVDSLKRGEAWYSTAGDSQVRIGWIRWCPGMNCHEGPYLISRGDLHRHITTGLHILRAPKSPDALENLPATGPRPIGATQGEGQQQQPREAVGAGAGGSAPTEGSGATGG
ncbi:MAG TPA: hypothetical protein VE219_05495 [Candidatus Sulfotelmatobacter sp.]|nr:hypothetical protein [Candidatus Sulfotelmatobacter sp.]